MAGDGCGNALRAVFETEPLEDGKGHPAKRVIAAAMDSFILSVTPFETVRRSWGMSKGEMAKQHVLFMAEDRPTYVGEMLGRMGVDSG